MIIGNHVGVAATRAR